MSEEERQRFGQMQRLITQSHSVIMATIDASGAPCASTTPFIESEGSYYIFVSQLAEHTQNLLAQGSASLIWAADLAVTNNPYARERATLQVSASPVGEDREVYLDLIESRHGKTVAMLRQLPDFVLFKLTPLKGQYVVGFGRAFSWDPATASLSHRSADSVVKASE